MDMVEVEDEERMVRPGERLRGVDRLETRHAGSCDTMAMDEKATPTSLLTVIRV